MSTRWVKVALSTLALSAVSVLPALPAAATGPHALAAPTASAAPDLALIHQTQWITPTTPGFSLLLAVGPGAGPPSDLHVGVTIYSRIDDASQLQQATSAVPDKTPLTTRPITVPVSARSTGLTADLCVNVLPEESSSAPAPGAVGACGAGAPTVVLGCSLSGETCDDVYPVSVALLRSGDSNPLERFTTFLTYEQPGVDGHGGPLRVSFVVPVHTGTTGQAPTADAVRATETLVGVLWGNRNAVPTTLDVSPTTVAALSARGGPDGARALGQLSQLTTAPGTSQLLSPAFVPINIAALSGVGLNGEIPLQVARGSQVLHGAQLHPSSGPWVDTGANLSSADATNLTAGLQAVRANQLVINDMDLASTESPNGLTLAEPFTLPLAHGAHVTAAASNSQIDSRFTADPADPVLAANQLLAGLAFVHFENVFLGDARGVVIVPPGGWHASSVFVATLLSGLTNTLILSPVTLDQLFAQVPIGGNSEPSTRHLQSGSVAGTGGFTKTSVQGILTARSRLDSFGTATSGHAAVMTSLSDQLLRTESSALGRGARAVALGAYDHSFDQVLSAISLAVERTITFTSATAAIPVTVLSTAPYPVTVVMTLSSDKFTFPAGANRTLVLTHPTTSVRVQARARTSGDHLPIDVTLRAPDGGLVFSQTVVDVHSTSISVVAVALTVLAGLVLLVWWARTWARSRRRRPRAH